MGKSHDDPSFSTAPTEAAVLLLPPGYVIGDYEVVDNIGRGGFGTVFKAVHTVIGKVVAIKVLHPNYSAQPHMVSRFATEARAVNRIQHKNIIDIFGFGSFQSELGQLQYYVMEYLQGESLEDYLQWHGALPIETTLSILRPLARALHAAHETGIAHRDLKADNVFLAEDREGFIEPKLLDFGIAKLLNDDHHAPGPGHRTREGVPVGTPGYMSPEQCQGHAVDHRTDVYAFGILAYRMLSGELPFDDRDSYMEVLFAHIHKPPVPLREVAPDVPESIERSILGMLAKSPAERPQNMLAAQQSLESAAMEAGLVVAREGTRITLSLLHETGAARGKSSMPMDDSAPTMDADGRTLDQAAEPGPDDEPNWDDLPTFVKGRQAAATPAEGAAAAAPAPAPMTLAPLTPPARTARNPTTTGEMEESETMLLPRARRPVLAIAAAGVAAVAGVGILVAVLLARSPATTPATPSTQPAPDRAGEIERAARQAPPVPAVAEPRPAASSAVPDLVSITIQGPPENTEVYGASGLLGVVPGTIQLQRRDGDVLLTFKADGYVPTTRSVDASREATIEVALVPRAQRRPPPRRGDQGAAGPAEKQGQDEKNVRDELESPF